MARQRKSNLLEQVYRFLAFRPRSEREVEDYLVRKKSGVDERVKILKRLKQGNFLNDEEFAKWFVDQRARLKPEGRWALKQELGRKGVKREIVERVLQEVDEVVEARKVVEKKKLAPGKMIALLARRGFSWETIRVVQQQWLGQEVDQW